MENKNFYEVFVVGMRKGWHLGTTSLLPNIVLGFALIQFLNAMGVLAFVGRVFHPVMGVFGLPGEAITALLATWLSAVGGVGVAASLYGQGVLTGENLSVLIPGIFLMGGQLQYMGRILAVAGVNTSHYAPMCVISLLNAFMAMFTMDRLFV